MSASTVIAHNLPPQPTPFVGRHDELAELARLLADPTCRLLTLTGPGGIGKTRLALEAARNVKDDFPDGVCFVSLAPVTSPAFLLSTICEALLLTLYGERYMKLQLLSYLNSKRLLLVLDNYEHLLEDVDLLTEILGAVPHAKILTTSRERLNLREEWVLELQGLPFPANDDETDIEGYSAVQLFVHTARRVNNAFSLSDGQKSAVTRICKLVGGMPLGIELAAAWVRALSCEQIAGELERSLDILETPVRNVESRHRTMRAVFEPTWERLSDNERTVFMKLSVFRGGFTREAAEQVAAATLRTLTALLDKSLLRVDANGRYDIHELLRQFGEDHLRQSDDDWKAANQRHCDYFADFMEARGRGLAGDKDAEALEAIEADLENVRAFWSWAVGQQNDRAMAAALDGLWQFYDTGSRFQEGERLFASTVDELRMRGSVPETRLLLGKVLARQGAMCRSLDLYKQAIALLRESEDILRAFAAPYDLALCLRMLGYLHLFEGQLEEAKEQCFASLELYRVIGDARGAAYAHMSLESVYQAEGDFAQAEEHAQAGLSIALGLGNQRAIAYAYLRLASLAIATASYREGWQYAQESLFRFQESGIIWGIAIAHRQMGWAALRLEQYAEAYQAVYQGLAVEWAYHLVSYWPETLWLVAFILLTQKKTSRALELLGLIEVVLMKTDLQSNFLMPDVSQRIQKLAAEMPYFNALMPGQSSGSQWVQKLTAELPPETYAALERGRSLDLHETIKKVLDELEQQMSVGKNAPAQPLVDPLTTRELEILHLVAEGMSNRAIAEHLFLAVGTVKWYISQICSKLQVQNRVQAIARARELNILL